MVDEKQTASPDVVENNDAAVDPAVDFDVIETVEETPAKPETKGSGSGSGGGRGSLLALIILGIIIVGGYFSWPLVQPLLLAQLQGEAPQTMAAIKQLDHRMVQLEAANARYDDAIATMTGAMADLTQQLDDLSKAVPGAEIITDLGQKLSALEDSLAQITQNAGESGTAALGALAEELDSLKARMSELATELATELTNSAADIPVLPDSAKANAQINAKINAKAIEATTALAAENEQLRQTVAALQTRLDQVEATVQQTAKARRHAGQGEGLVLAVGQLRQTVLAGRPYVAPLAAVAALADGADGAAETEQFSNLITTLTPTAKQGVATHRALSDQFPSVARAVLQADGGEGDSFLQRTWQRFSSLVTVRRVGEVEGAEADAILARAERRLAAGELAAAIKSMDALTGPAMGAAQAWMERAQTRLGAELALAGLQSRAIAALGDS